MFRSLSLAATATGAALSASTTKPLVSLTDPLTRRNCNAIRDALHSAYPLSEERPDPSETHAAVLVPLCNVDERPGVLFEVRGKLRTHSGEVRYVFFMVAARRRQPDASYIVADSFPGGKVDKGDPTTLAAALRETEEEVGISPDQVELLGRFGPAELSLGGMRVWPYVGFVHPRSSANNNSGQTDEDTPLPSLSLSTLTLSPREVAHAFHLPFSAAVSPPRLHSYMFRGARPYYAISVADIVAGSGAVHTDNADGEAEVRWMNDPEPRDEIGGGQEGRLEVWGLTGWYLNAFMRILRVYEP